MEIRTPRLLLRELEESDAPHTNLYESDPRVVRYQGHGQRTLAESLSYIQKVRRDTAADSPRRLFDLGLIYPQHQPEQLIGRVGLHVKDPVLREGELWYELHPAHWGQGLVPEAMAALVELGFGELGLHRIVIETDPRNRASIRVAQKLGMRQEAHFVENYLDKGEWCDSLIFGMLYREWAATHARPPATAQAE